MPISPLDAYYAAITLLFIAFSLLILLFFAAICYFAAIIIDFFRLLRFSPICYAIADYFTPYFFDTADYQLR